MKLRVWRDWAVEGCLGAVIALASAAPGADWPTWRGGPGRGAYSPQALPDQLHLQWVRELPPPKSAWPWTQYKQLFDESYEPVAAGKTLFVGSMVRDSVTAYDTDTGGEKWRFYADGPVRFAPAVAEGRVYFVSDDGFLYCLDAAAGKLLWKFRGAPLDNKVLGNERLVSAWPARGAPVVYDGRVYFAAGVWPFMGIFLHALDARTGEVVWSNSGSGSVYILQPHSSPAFAGVAPQGYLVATPDRLIVPGGRSVPACYDRLTGEFLYHHPNTKNGGYGVWEANGWFFNDGVICRLKDGKPLARGKASILGTDEAIGMEVRVDESKVPPAVLLAGGPVPERAKRYLIAGHSLDIQLRMTTKIDRRGRKVRTRAYTAPLLWKVDATGELERIFIRAGDRVYGSRGGTVAAMEIPPAAEPREDDDKAPVPPARISWRATIDAAAWNMLAADGKLFVVTRDGTIYCFGRAKVEARTYAYEPADPPSGAAPVGKRGQEPFPPRKRLLTPFPEAGPAEIPASQEGYCLVLGLGAGQEAIRKRSSYATIVLEGDARKVAACRESLDAAGLYGRQVHVLPCDPGAPGSAKLPPYLASLVLCPDARAAGLGRGEAFVREVFRVLRPYGGRAILTAAAGREGDLADLIRKADLPGAEVSLGPGPGQVSLVRKGPLPGAGDWTHQYADAANTVCSRDALVRAPLGLLWFGGPSNWHVLPRHAHGPAPQVAGGRLIIEGPGTISARDVYTGRVLWRRLIPGLDTFGMYYDETYVPDPYDRSYNQEHIPGANELDSNYVTTPDRLYVLAGSVCHVLDMATGKTLGQLSLPPDQDARPPNWGSVSIDGDRLIATALPIDVPLPNRKRRRRPPSEDFRPLIEPDALWQYLAGSHPQGPWTHLDFKAEGWRTGEPGFGYGDGDDQTVLKGMRGRYRVVYVRKTFDVPDTGAIPKLVLGIDYDDAFIAYLNGTEVLRVGVGKGSGVRASGVRSHDAEGYEYFDIQGHGSLLREGTNVLAIEGHNDSLKSGDFSLDPWLGVPWRDEAQKQAYRAARDRQRREARERLGAEGLKAVPRVTMNSPYASASGMLVVMDRRSGQVLWRRAARLGFRHNAVAAGAGKVFCIDGLSEGQVKALRRRGWEVPQDSTLWALDAATGRVVWRNDQDVFGTWLGYSAQHDVLLQAGSKAGDRARDEVGEGMVAYRGADGKVLWALDEEYAGPPILHHRRIITQTGGGNTVATPAKAFDLLTGKPVTRTHPLTGQTIPWTWVRFKGCNTAVASENLLTFRSASAAFVDLTGGQGTASIGGFKSGCTSNLIAADGVLSAPDYTRTCTCAYQQQSSLALVHEPQMPYWTVDDYPPVASPQPVRRVGINFGAPGNRFADGPGAPVLWMEFPSIAGPSPDLPVRCTYAKAGPKWFRLHPTCVRGAPDWVAASGVAGVREVAVRVFLQPPAGSEDDPDAEPSDDPDEPRRVDAFDKHVGRVPKWREEDLRGRFEQPRPYTVRLHFAETLGARPGERVFDVALQGKEVLKDFDIAREAGGAGRGIVREFKGVLVTDDLKVTLTPRVGEPLLCGLEIVAQKP